jgi:hypothetical protein
VFRIAPRLLFEETADLAAQFFFVQRCGGEVPGWHKACHLDDARLPDGAHRDLTGGWHDAGDYNKWMGDWNQSGSAYALVTAYLAGRDHFDRIDRDRDGRADILDEALWGARFLARPVLSQDAGRPHRRPVEQHPSDEDARLLYRAGGGDGQPARYGG